MKKQVISLLALLLALTAWSDSRTNSSPTLTLEWTNTFDLANVRGVRIGYGEAAPTNFSEFVFCPSNRVTITKNLARAKCFYFTLFAIDAHETNKFTWYRTNSIADTISFTIPAIPTPPTFRVKTIPEENEH